MSGTSITSFELEVLSELEAESIYILREVLAEFKNPVLLFSGGKDSVVLTRLLEKALSPCPMHVPLMLVDTGHNFPETLKFIEQRVKTLGTQLITASVEQDIREGRVKDPRGPYASRNRIQSMTLMRALREHRFDAVIGGARRDEEKARAKERVFSLRNHAGQWQPEQQRPELWNLFNTHLNAGEHMRVFPLSQWTELDIWRYIEKEKLSVPEIYFSHLRDCVRRGETLLPVSPYLETDPQDPIEKSVPVRFRTVGDMTCSSAFLSEAQNVSDIINELKKSKITERGGRLDDKGSETSMEDRKTEGYF